VQSNDSGINKPFDRIFKAVAEEAPALFLRLLGVIPAGAEVEIKTLRLETAPPVVMPDYVAVLRDEAGGQRIVHLEFQSTYYCELPRDVARYGGSLAWQYQMAVDSVLVLLRPHGVPVEIPAVGRYKVGETETTHPFRAVRMWELDPAPVLACGDARVLPWALLMKSSDAQVREIALLMAQQQDEEAIARYFLLGSVRYDRSSLQAMLGGGKMGFERALMEASSIFREARDEGRDQGLAEGRDQGLAEGRATEARRLVRRALQRKFPELESIPELDGISDVGVLESLFDQVYEARDVDLVRQAILAAAGQSH